MNAQDLKTIPLFRELDAATLERLAEVVESRDLSDGDTIFNEGDTGNAVYFIAKGAVKIEKKIDASGTATKTLAVLGTGEFFGEMSLFDGKPRSAATVALGPGRVYRVVRDAFEALMESDSAVAAGLLFAIINTCNERIRSLNSKVVVFHEIGKAIGEGHDLQGLLEIVLRQLVNASGAESGALLLKQEFSEHLELRGRTGLSLSAEQLDQIMEGMGVPGKVLKDREVLLIDDFDKEDSCKDLPRSGLENTSMILQPVLADDTPLGVICLGHPDQGHFDLDDVNLCSSVASQCGQAILNFRHREEEAARLRLDRKYVQF
jgi:CRP/FNR family cyclic AMP-dependent transcriptional regulator